jgi:putative flippase GtrA
MAPNCPSEGCFAPRLAAHVPRCRERGAPVAGKLPRVSVPVTTSPASPARSGFVHGLWDRFGRLVRELGRFGVVGATAFTVDVIIYNLLLSDLGPFWAKVCSTVISAPVAFVGNRFWTWQHRPRTALHQEYALYFAFNAVGLGISEACAWLSHNALGHAWPEVFHTRLADNLSTQIVGTGLALFFRFWAYRRFVFPDPVQPAPDGEPRLDPASHLP